MHTNPEYCLAVTQLGSTNSHLCGIGFALTLGDGNRLVCEAIEMLSRQLLGSPIEDLMAKFGSVSQSLAEDPTLRWLGPQKGVVHLALASITNACFDLWAKSRGVPLWKLLLDLEPEAVVRLLDLSYLDEVLDANGAEAILREQQSTRSQRDAVLRGGYPGYDTSIGWMAYDDAKIRGLTQLAIDKGLNAFKLKVGSRAHARPAAGSHVARMRGGCGNRNVRREPTVDLAGGSHHVCRPRKAPPFVDRSRLILTTLWHT